MPDLEYSNLMIDGEQSNFRHVALMANSWLIAGSSVVQRSFTPGTWGAWAMPGGLPSLWNPSLKVYDISLSCERKPYWRKEFSGKLKLTQICHRNPRTGRNRLVAKSKSTALRDFIDNSPRGNLFFLYLFEGDLEEKKNPIIDCEDRLNFID
jgi:hypothetical protein